MFDEESQEFIVVGTVSAVFLHVVLGYALVVGLMNSIPEFPPQVVYSVTIEGGKVLGGMAKVAEDEKAPNDVLRKTSGAEPRPEPEVKIDKPVVQPKEPDPEPDAEVSLAEEKPTPVPTAVPTPTRPQATPTARPVAPTPAPAAKTPTPKKSAAPTAKPQPKKNTSEEVDKRYQETMRKYLGGSSDAGGKTTGAGKLGGSGYGGGELRPPEFFEYARLMERRVKEAWNWFDQNTPLITVVVFRLDPNGRVSDVEVDRSSGNSQFDDSVIRAVYKAKLPPPPEAVYEKYFKFVRMTFNPREM